MYGSEGIEIGVIPWPAIFAMLYCGNGCVCQLSYLMAKDRAKLFNMHSDNSKTVAGWTHLDSLLVSRTTPSLMEP